MTIYLIRHGESEAIRINRTTPIFTGQWDCDLTEEGLRQARALRDDPRLRDVDAVYSSDLRRAVQTAHAITDLPIITDRRLRERSLGEFEGKEIAALQKNPRYAAYFRDRDPSSFRHHFSARVPGGENYRDVCDRLAPFLDALRASGKERVILVSHFCAIRCVKMLLLGVTEEEIMQSEIPCCSPIVVEI